MQIFNFSSCNGKSFRWLIFMDPLKFNFFFWNHVQERISKSLPCFLSSFNIIQGFEGYFHNYLIFRHEAFYGSLGGSDSPMPFFLVIKYVISPIKTAKNPNTINIISSGKAIFPPYILLKNKTTREKKKLSQKM